MRSPKLTGPNASVQLTGPRAPRFDSDRTLGPRRYADFRTVTGVICTQVGSWPRRSGTIYNAPLDRLSRRGSDGSPPVALLDRTRQRLEELTCCSFLEACGVH